MMRFASSASVGWTEIVISPNGFTAMGNGFGCRDATTSGSPCASSSPRTMLASTSERVWKMTTRSDKFVGHSAARRGERLAVVLDFQQNHGHVIVLGGAADKRLDFGEHVFAKRFRCQVEIPLEKLSEPALTEAVVGRVHRLGDAVREEHVE